MTIIEFFDKSPLENLAGALLCRPERVIFVGDQRKELNRTIQVYERVLAKRGCHTILESRPIGMNHLTSIVSEFEAIVNEYGDCVFDLTGGNEPYLVAIGITMAKYGSRVKCQSFNLKNSKIIDSDADGVVCNVQSFDLSVDEIIMMHGGAITREATIGGEDGFTDAFCEDAEKVWRVCCEDPTRWNSHVGAMAYIDRFYGSQEGLDVSFEKQSVFSTMQRIGMTFVWNMDVMKSLARVGLIKDLSDGKIVSFSYKNEFVKRCLTVAGQILEQVLAVKLKRLTDNDGVRLYHDVRVGVMIDWDGYNGSDETRTLNEIDVIAMKDAIPVFISCKNGEFTVDELYKLSSVAERFGTRYAKKALVISDMDKLGTKADAIRARAEDMKIKTLENADSADEDRFARFLRSLWRD